MDYDIWKPGLDLLLKSWARDPASSHYHVVVIPGTPPHPVEEWPSRVTEYFFHLVPGENQLTNVKLESMEVLTI